MGMDLSLKNHGTARQSEAAPNQERGTLNYPWGEKANQIQVPAVFGDLCDPIYRDGNSRS